MEFLATRGVMTLGTDSASMGPLPDLAEPTHYAGLKHGMIWTEERDEPGRAAADRRVLLHARPEASGRARTAKAGRSRSSAATCRSG